jgi:hypothetical protein
VQSFIETYFEQIIYPNDFYKWHAHTTTGFIKDGTRLSVLVLHNAANPFTWGMASDSTTSVGVYGRYAHTHSEIHWTTIAPGIGDFVKMCVDEGFWELKQKWHVDMQKASEKRFHKAYWLAANMLPLKGLLNHGLQPERPHDALEEGEISDDFEISEQELQSGWDGVVVSVEQSEATWQRILDEVDGLDVQTLGSEHIEIGGTERAFMASD